MIIAELLPSGYNPVLVFTIVLLIILLAPMVMEKLRLPGIIGMILAGVIFGPYGLNVLENNAAFRLFGTVGLLYLMFMAGLEMDMNQFRQSRMKSLTFGLLTFTIPLAIGFPVCYYLLEYNFLGSLLIASMFSTHTLISYPIVQKLGITKNEAVIIAIGGTIITDVMVLVLLAVISTTASGESDLMAWTKFVGFFSASSLIVLTGFPALARWFFHRIEGEKVSHYIFVLTLVFVAALLFELSGVEPIIGAFLAGLSLNRLIPKSSPLMSRIDFMGNALFIPFFLISVGMLVNTTALTSSIATVSIAVTLTLVALLGKWIASLVTQKILGLQKDQRNLIFGLSSSHAAATIAVILVGFRIGIVDENVLDATILLIFITCLLASLVTARAGKRIAVKNLRAPTSIETFTERILVPISNPATIEYLIDFAMMIRTPTSIEPVVPFAVVRDNEEAHTNMENSRKILDKAAKHASASNSLVNLVTRIDVNASSAISRASRELGITDIVIGWHSKLKTADKIFGTTLDRLLKQTGQTLFVCRLVAPLNVFKRLKLFVPENAELEKGFEDIMLKIIRMAKHTEASLLISGSHACKASIESLLRKNKTRVSINWSVPEGRFDTQSFFQQIAPQEMVVLIGAREGSISYEKDLDSLPEIITTKFSSTNIIVVYPAQ
jgi:Kef-type K+ transport system membrane component KefB